MIFEVIDQKACKIYRYVMGLVEAKGSNGLNMNTGGDHIRFPTKFGWNNCSTFILR